MVMGFPYGQFWRVDVVYSASECLLTLEGKD
jgi:hypothetical protein